MFWKALGAIAIGLLLAVLAFYLWGTSGSYSRQRYAEIVVYGEESDRPTDILTVATYNIGYLSGLTNNLAVARDRDLFDANLTTVLQAFAPLDVDILGLQEIDLDAKRSFRTNQAAELAAGLDFAAGAIAVNWDKNYVPFPYWPPSAHFGRVLSGQAVLSRFPIRSHDRVVLEKVADNPFFYNAFYLDRLVQVARVEIGDRPCVVMNVHLEAFDEPTRRSQTAVVRELWQRYAREFPTLLLGDFNSLPPSPERPDPTVRILLAAADIEPAFDRAALSDTSLATFPSDAPEGKLDYIFYNPSRWELLSARVVAEAERASDHLPAIAKLRLKAIADASS